jgi:phosphatidylglycerol:prolipoprotein diacylglycerol transferase
VYPVLFEIHGFQVSPFGVMVALAFLAGGWTSARSLEKAGFSAKIAWDLLTWCVLGGLLGAKLWYVAEQLARDPQATFLATFFARGGLTWYGGFLGGTLFGLVAARSYQLPLLAVLNAASPALALSHAIGRIGCFLVGDDYGIRSTVPWAVAFPKGYPPTVDPITGEVFHVHPTMLYESFLLLPVFALLWARRGRSPFLFGEYLVLSGVVRFWVETLRLNPSLVAGLSNAQVVSVVGIAGGAAAWLWFWSRARTPAVSAGSRR